MPNKRDENKFHSHVSSWNEIAAIATFVAAVATIGLLIYAGITYNRFVESVNLTAKDIELTHKPVVFIKESIPPIEGTNDPMKWGFGLFNSGNLPARDVTAKCLISQVAGTNRGINNTFLFPVQGKATVYPNSELVFTIPNNFIDFGLPVTEAEAVFSISYISDINKNEIYTESMKWLFAPETGNKWVYVGPEISLGIK